ncbi:MAG: hypothetical protein ACKON8_04370, partial [Planctomycetota bacterium]
IPFENRLVVGELSASELCEVVAEDAAGDKRCDRILWPFAVAARGDGAPPGLSLAGRPVDPGRRVRIAFNNYDAQSGGRRLPRLAEILRGPAAKRELVLLDPRGAVVARLLERGTVS